MNKYTFSAFSMGVIIGGSLMVIVAGISWFAGPALEGRFFPVIRLAFVVGSVKRIDHEICWQMHNKRFRVAVPARFDYRAIYEGKVYALNVERIAADGKRVALNQYGFAQHEPGEVWDVTYCAELPRKIPDHAAFMVEGEGYYDTGHPWRVQVILPAFEVPG